ncbi:MAG TPA: LCP family protein [Solirubrobacteraceae bacterium]|nr:LCP family protein [Solirubrobacteraceae bacterium]
MSVRSPSPPPPTEPHAPRRRWFPTSVKLALGCLVVLLASAGATAVFVLEQVHTVVQDLKVSVPLSVSRKALAHDYYGGPETLLFIGDDTRSVYKYYNAFVPNLANEMLLVRIDPSKPYISMLSLPRELWVPITEPNGVTITNRLNSAYTYGTTTLLQTIKQVTGLSVNHVIATTFTQFENAINKLGCVYDTIDERYYNLNNGAPGTDYQSINLQPGYQCLTGSEAEQFVSYRHTDTSQIRDARDQSFLLAVKKQYGPQLAGNIGKFEQIFGQTVQTDPGLRSQTEILNLANLLITAAGLRVRQVPFQTSPLPSGDLTASPQQIQQSVNSFLNGGSAPPTKQTAAVARQVGRRGALAHLPLTPTLATNVAAEKAATGGIPFTAEFPTVQDLAGSGAYTVSPQCTTQVQTCVRDYLIHAPGGKAYPIYTEVFSNGQLGQFYDVQGTTWVNAPLFADPNQTVQVGKRTYYLYYDGSQLSTVAWQQYGAMYWVHNTLTDAVGNGELLAIAEQTVPISGVVNAGGAARGKKGKATPNLRAVAVPTLTTPTTKLSTVETVGSIGGVVALAALPLLLFGVVRRRRQLRRLRAELRELDDRQAYLLAATAATRDSWAEIVGPPTPGPPVHPRPGPPVYPRPGPPVYPPPRSLAHASAGSPVHASAGSPVYAPAGVAARPPLAAPTRPAPGGNSSPPTEPHPGLDSSPPARPPADVEDGTPPPATAAARRRIRV